MWCVGVVLSFGSLGGSGPGLQGAAGLGEGDCKGLRALLRARKQPRPAFACRSRSSNGTKERQRVAVFHSRILPKQTVPVHGEVCQRTFTAVL